MNTTSSVSSLPGGYHRQRLRLGPVGSMVGSRLGVLASIWVGAQVLAPPAADPVGTGLLCFTLISAVSGTWALIDGLRHPWRVAGVAWLAVVALALLVDSLWQVLAGGAGDEGGGAAAVVAATLDGAALGLVLVALPAAAGLGLGAWARGRAHGGSPDR